MKSRQKNWTQRCNPNHPKWFQLSSTWRSRKKGGRGKNALKTFKNPEAKVKGKSAKRRKFDKPPLKAETSELTLPGWRKSEINQPLDRLELVSCYQNKPLPYWGGPTFRLVMSWVIWCLQRGSVKKTKSLQENNINVGLTILLQILSPLHWAVHNKIPRSRAKQKWPKQKMTQKDV